MTYIELNRVLAKCVSVLCLTRIYKNKINNFLLRVFNVE